MALDDISISHGFNDPLRWWPVERQNMFTDAVFSIISTIAIANLDLKEKELVMDDFILRDALIDHIPKFVAYFGCFFITSSYWGCHVRLYSLVVNSNDVLTWLNLLLLCVLSFLPLTLSLWADSDSLRDTLAHFPSVNLFLVCLILTATILYVFRERAAHHTHVLSSDRAQRKFAILLYAWFPTLIGLFCIYIYKLAEVALCVLFLLVLLTAVVVTKIERWYLGSRFLDIAVERVTSPLPMDRIEAFSDGVYAISMTLMAVQTAEKMSSYRAHATFLDVFASSSSAYLAAFGVVSVLWFVHHQLCHNIEQSNPVIQSLNTLALAYVGGVPFSSGLIQFYADPRNYTTSNYRSNEQISVQFHCLVLFFSGFFQAVMWCAASFMRVTSVNYNTGSDYLILFKAMTVPVISCVVYLSTLVTPHASAIFLLLTTCIPFIFAGANLVHRKHHQIRTSLYRVFRRIAPDTEPANSGLLETSRDLSNSRSDHHPYVSFLPRSP